MTFEEALLLLAARSGWTLKDTEHDPDSALWAASGVLVEARNTIRDGKARGLHS